MASWYCDKVKLQEELKATKIKSNEKYTETISKLNLKLTIFQTESVDRKVILRIIKFIHLVF